MKRTISFAFIFLQIVIFVNANGFYTIVAPGTIQSNYEYTVSITLHETKEPATITVGINSTKYSDAKTVEVSPSDTKVVHFDIPTIEESDYKLVTEGVKGLIFKNTTDLLFGSAKPKVYIQTDKAVYKPGDLVQYRILALDEHTRPAKLVEPLNVGIRDGASNHIKQLNDIKLNKGVFTGEIQLSEQPVLGNWMIDVTSGAENKQKTEKKFEVAKYVLPKFSVDIETAKDVAIYDGVIKMTVRSKYTYGKPLKGKATVTIAASPNTEATEKTIDVDGKGHLEFDLVKDLKFNKEKFGSSPRFISYLPPLQVLAVVTEGYTGNTRNKTTSINLEPSRYRITVPENIHLYTPNKTFEIKAYIKNLDGSPVLDAKSKAKLSIRTQPYYFSNHDSTETKQEFEMESEVMENGMVSFMVSLPGSGYYGDVSIQYEEKKHYLGGLNAKKETQEMEPKQDAVGPLKIVAQTKKPRLGEDLTFEVKSDDHMPYFVYTVTGRGKMLKHEYVALGENEKSHTVSVKATFDMVPRAKIFAYFVKDGELKFDETTINIENEFENKIEISAPEQAKPSEEVTLNIKADPDSFVGLLGVDQSVLLLQSGNDLDPKTIKSDLDAYDTRTPYIRGYGQYPGKDSGLITMTNANYPYNTEIAGVPFYMLWFARGPGGPVYITPRSQAPVSTRQRRPQALSSPALAHTPKIREVFMETWIFEDINKYECPPHAHVHTYV